MSAPSTGSKATAACKQPKELTALQLKERQNRQEKAKLKKAKKGLCLACASTDLPFSQRPSILRADSIRRQRGAK